MNKVAIVVALLVACAIVVSANKIHHKKRHHPHNHIHRGELEHGGFGDHGHKHHGHGHGHGHGLGHGFGHGPVVHQDQPDHHDHHDHQDHHDHHDHHDRRGCLLHLSDEDLFDEIEQRRFKHHGKRPSVSGPKFRKSRPGRHFGKNGGGGIGPVIGGAGGIVGSERSEGAIGASNHHGRHNLAQGSENHLIDSKSGIQGHHNEFDNESDSDLHKHEGFNKDKTTVRDQSSGFKDVDANRHSNSHGDSAGFAASKEDLIAGGQSGRIENSDESDQKFDASGSHRADVAAGAVVGAGL